MTDLWGSTGPVDDSWQPAPRHQPLARRMRPATLAEVAGQDHITHPGGPLASLIRALSDTSDTAITAPSSVVLWGPAGCGKTTLASLVATESGAPWHPVSAIGSGVKDLRAAIDTARTRLASGGRRSVLFVDEIHRFSKAQQDSLLPAVENGLVVLIAATTENPQFALINPLLSRSLMLRLQPLTPTAVETVIDRAITDDRGLRGTVTLTDEARTALTTIAGAEARKALTVLEAAATAALHPDTNPAGSDQGSADDDQATPDGDAAPTEPSPAIITEEIIATIATEALVSYDRAGDGHYDTTSALIKSIRGSDVDAALHYFAVMAHAGEDVAFIGRRLMISAAEDIGTADPQALVQATSAHQAATAIGWPEARIVLAQAVIYLALAPKSNAVVAGIGAALGDVRDGKGTGVPAALRDAHYSGAKHLGHGDGYKYAHDDPTGVVSQQYAPDDLVGVDYFHPSPRGTEGSWRAVLEKLRSVIRRK